MESKIEETFSLQWALLETLKGNTVRHLEFTTGDAVSAKENDSDIVEFEDGCAMNAEEFWADLREFTGDVDFSTGWHLTEKVIPRVPEHHRGSVCLKDVKVGDLIDMDAGLFLRKNESTWSQIDGGYGIECSEDDVKGWLYGS